MNILEEFKKFIARGNVVDLAVGVIIGAAFGKIVNSLVNDIVMPPIGKLLRGIDFSSLFFAMDGRHYDSLQEAKRAGAATINYGVFINTLIEFLIVATCVFLLVKLVNRMRHHEAQAAAANPPPPTTSEKLLMEIRDELRRRSQ